MKMTKEEFVEKISNLELSEDRVISKLSEELQKYEKKYKLRSEIFYKIIVGTPAEDTPDFIAVGHMLQKLFPYVSVEIFDRGDYRGCSIIHNSRV